MQPPDETLDVVVIGAGFAGSALAAALGARGFAVALCDPHDVHPRDFRAEKLSPPQVDALRRLDLAEPVLRVATPISEVAVARRGVLVDRRSPREYGLDYHALVGALREQVPASAWRRHRVESIGMADGRRVVTLQGAPALRAKLVVLATGLAVSLRKPLGLERAILSQNHSLSIGFDLEIEASARTRASLTYYGERIEDRVGYLTLFPIGERIRANLFVYRDIDEPWSRAFRADPAASLARALPRLGALLPPFTIPEPPQLRPIHLYGPPARVVDGVALIGDAYSTTCPAGGGGLSKGLIDVERLIAHIPRWLASGEAVAARDIEDFERDPFKVASEARARRTAETSRASAIDSGIFWEARRRRNYYGMRVNGWLRRRFASEAM